MNHLSRLHRTGEWRVDDRRNPKRASIGFRPWPLGLVVAMLLGLGLAGCGDDPGGDELNVAGDVYAVIIDEIARQGYIGENAVSAKANSLTTYTQVGQLEHRVDAAVWCSRSLAPKP
ncbi:hypothetical protein [Candidatus Poriferisodalis sp.]|uniref:hypothetical protein n=1 Tax=Candidatus Poriferisodalis sp. TaxID=3101277 RepID=UPI003B523E8C